MAARKPPYSAKVKFWMPSYSGELEGGIQGCAVELFQMLPIEQQAKALQKMQTSHQQKSQMSLEKS
ncbi:hypothetical protein [Pantoea ananatis]|uniref:hypothetical protein n=1 Tax=Pantoea ananas TaxID=553 RepID=UPI000F88AC4E|nr:hypothetical protein [Pantoea ananatis]RQN03376.1 hypothetical protein EHQ51_00255 [Pantoea ananatis]